MSGTLLTPEYPAASAFGRLLGLLAEIDRFKSIQTLLSWDQHTYMPSGGEVPRGEQIELVAGLGHKRLTSDRMRRLLDAAGEQVAASGNFDSPQAHIVRLAREDCELERQLQALSSPDLPVQPPWLTAPGLKRGTQKISAFFCPCLRK